MTVAKDQLGLTDGREEWLRRMPHAMVATIQADGMPQVTPNWYWWDGERFWISTLDWTIKVKNLKRDPRITLCIEEWKRRTQYVQVFGTAEVIEGDVKETTLDLIRKYEATEEASQQHWEDIKEARVLIAVTPTRMQWRYDDLPDTTEYHITGH